MQCKGRSRPDRSLESIGLELPYQLSGGHHSLPARFVVSPFLQCASSNRGERSSWPTPVYQSHEATSRTHGEYRQFSSVLCVPEPRKRYDTVRSLSCTAHC